MTEDLFNGYASVFAKFTMPYQQEAYERIAPYLRGKVLDAGCGCAKLAAYIPGVTNVTSYMGVDYSEPMVTEGKKLLASIGRRDFDILLQRIEDTEDSYDSVVSIQSYYSWNDSAETLRHLYQHTTDGGTLVLATANNRLDIERLIQQCSRGWLLHPDWPRYVGYNRKLASLPGGRFVSLDTLIGEVRSSGFEIINTDVTLFEGGVNMVVARKPNRQLH